MIQRIATMNELDLAPAVFPEEQPEDMLYLEVMTGEFKGLIFSIGKFKFPFLMVIFPKFFKPSYDFCIIHDPNSVVASKDCYNRFIEQLEYTFFIEK